MWHVELSSPKFLSPLPSTPLNYLMPRMKQLFPNINWHKGKGMNFHFAKPELKTKAGIIGGSTITGMWKRPSNLKSRPMRNDTSLDDILLYTDSYQSLYCQLLCGIYQNDIVFRVGALFASTLIHVLKFLENNWVGLGNDIWIGTLNNPKITNS